MHLLLFLLLALHASASSPAFLTPEFTPAWDEAERGFSPAASRLLADARVLFVAGVISDDFIRCSERRGRGGLGCSYFDESVVELRARGADVERVAIESEATTVVNAATIAASIARSSRPVVLVTHSKGCLDALEALASRPDLQAKVAGWISVEGPYFGSPVADWIDGSRALRRFFEKLAPRLGGTIEALHDLRTADRARYMADRAHEIRALVDRVPVISVVGWKPREFPRRNDTPLWPIRDAMLKLGIESDGLVPRASSVLPGSRILDLPGLDHAMPAYHVPTSEKFDRARFYRALLGILASNR